MLKIPKRYKLIMLSQVGFMVVYALRVNLSVAIVSMVNSTYSKPKPDPECSNGKNETIQPNHGEFNWNGNQQGLVLGAFFYGYIFTQVLGGWLAKNYGAKHVFGIGVLVTSLLTLITPLAAKTNFAFLIFVRVVEGIGEGVTFPAIHALIGQWAPPLERTQMAVLSYSGQHLGTILALPISGILCDSKFLGGWPSVFYVFGALGVLWVIAWTFYASNTPEEDMSMPFEEREYILDSLKGCASHAKSYKTPWLAIFKSTSVWAAIVGHTCNNWVWYMVLNGLPTYFEEVLNFKLKQNAFLSALPFLVGFIFYLSSGFLADKLRKSGLTTVNTRRLFALFAYFPAAAFLLGASYAGCSQVALSVTCMVLATGFLCLNASSYSANHLDIGPRYSGILMGITNTFATIPGFVTPAVTGYFTNGDPSRAQYRKVFAIAAAVCSFGGIFFITFVSGTEQPWNNPHNNEKDEDKNEEEKSLIQ